MQGSWVIMLLYHWYCKLCKCYYCIYGKTIETFNKKASKTLYIPMSQWMLWNQGDQENVYNVRNWKLPWWSILWCCTNASLYLLLESTWKYDLGLKHDGTSNKYAFIKDG